MMEELLLGFDAREMRTKMDAWSNDRKTSFLLKLDVIKPLSTDSAVWPSAFSIDARFPEHSGRRHGNVWGNLQEMKDALTKGDSGKKPYWLIGITELVSKKTEQEWNRFPIKPFELDTNWELLGYDVSDEVLLSGLSNGGSTKQEMEALRTKWSSSLNQYHLFNKRDEAIKFVKLQDKQIPEHSPFSAYGIYLIEKVD